MYQLSSFQCSNSAEKYDIKIVTSLMVTSCLVGLVPDAESFGFLDVEEWRFNLWLVVFPV